VVGSSFTGWSGQDCLPLARRRPRRASAGDDLREPEHHRDVRRRARGRPARERLHVHRETTSTLPPVPHSPAPLHRRHRRTAPSQRKTVTFTAVRRAAPGRPGFGDNTNAQGIATITATANGTAGTYTVNATVRRSSPATFTLTNVGPPAAITCERRQFDGPPGHTGRPNSPHRSSRRSGTPPELDPASRYVHRRSVSGVPAVSNGELERSDGDGRPPTRRACRASRQPPTRPPAGHRDRSVAGLSTPATFLPAERDHRTGRRLRGERVATDDANRQSVWRPSRRGGGGRGNSLPV
jgi:hypothetical protein